MIAWTSPHTYTALNSTLQTTLYIVLCTVLYTVLYYTKKLYQALKVAGQDDLFTEDHPFPCLLYVVTIPTLY